MFRYKSDSPSPLLIGGTTSFQSSGGKDILGFSLADDSGVFTRWTDIPTLLDTLFYLVNYFSCAVYAIDPGLTKAAPSAEPCQPCAKNNASDFPKK